MDILEILREIERFKDGAPPQTHLAFEKRYGARRAVWKPYKPDINDSVLLFSYAYKDNHGDFREFATPGKIAKWFEEV